MQIPDYTQLKMVPPGYQQDPATGKYVDPNTHYEWDPKTGYTHDPGTGLTFDPDTNHWAPPDLVGKGSPAWSATDFSHYPPAGHDGGFVYAPGQPYGWDAQHGLLKDPQTGYVYNTHTGVTTDPAHHLTYDPASGGWQPSSVHGRGEPGWDFDHHNYEYDGDHTFTDPKTGYTYNDETHVTTDPHTGYSYYPPKYYPESKGWAPTGSEGHAPPVGGAVWAKNDEVWYDHAPDGHAGQHDGLGGPLATDQPVTHDPTTAQGPAQGPDAHQPTTAPGATTDPAGTATGSSSTGPEHTGGPEHYPSGPWSDPGTPGSTTPGSTTPGSMTPGSTTGPAHDPTFVPSPTGPGGTTTGPTSPTMTPGSTPMTPAAGASGTAAAASTSTAASSSIPDPSLTTPDPVTAKEMSHDPTGHESILRSPTSFGHGEHGTGGHEGILRSPTSFPHDPHPAQTGQHQDPSAHPGGFNAIARIDPRDHPGQHHDPSGQAGQHLDPPGHTVQHLDPVFTPSGGQTPSHAPTFGGPTGSTGAPSTPPAFAGSRGPQTGGDHPTGAPATPTTPLHTDTGAGLHHADPAPLHQTPEHTTAPLHTESHESSHATTDHQAAEHHTAAADHSSASAHHG